MRVIGLTGGIAMGKSTVASVFGRAHVPVLDADAVVRALQVPGGAALPALDVAFPGTVARDRAGRLVLDRAKLRERVLADRSSLAMLESIMHPMVRQAERRFLAAARRRGAALVVLDIPLLFETRGTSGLDLVIAVSAPATVQLARLRRRGGLSEGQIAAVRARQLSDARRRRAAGLVVRTGLSRHHAWAMTSRILQRLRSRPPPPPARCGR